MATVIPLFVVPFAGIYSTMSHLRTRRVEAPTAQPRIFAFCAANSSSVRMPSSWSFPSFSSSS